MPRVAARGVSFHVQDLGPRSAAVPAVVMLHGLMIGSLASWYFTAAPALARARHVRLYDLRGHGRSERTRTGYDVATMVADLGALTADLAAPFDLVGHSFGAVVALRFALDHPARVRRLALVEAPLPPANAGELTDVLDDAVTAPEHILAALPAGLRAAVAGGKRQAVRLLDALRFLAHESTLIADLRAEPDVPDAALAGLSAPVLLVYGDRSACRPTGERLARAIPDARLAVLPGGHYLHLDASAALTAVLQDHLGG